jgi:PIN domain nuclease of toxin-antitoxin system
VTTVVVDTHVLHWWTAEPERLSRVAAAAVEGATEIAVAGITWFELAWLADHDKIVLDVPVRSWLDGLAADVRTIPVSPAIAATAVDLPGSFPGDPRTV